MRPTVLLLMASALSPVSNSVMLSGGEDVGRRMSSGDAFSSSSFRSSRNSAEEETGRFVAATRCRAITDRDRED